MTLALEQSGGPTGPASPRLVSLDAFRGITIAGMILVNNPGSWRTIYAPLRHAHWNGWSPTDLVFPFFLFIVGVSMAFSFGRRIEQGASRVALLGQVLRRSVVLFLLGLIMYSAPDYRLMGPYVLVVVGLSLAGAVGKDGVRARNVAGWVVFAIGVIYFVADFGYFNASGLRVPGVLQRIALCYLAVSFVVMIAGTGGRVFVTAGLLVGYWAVVRYVSPPSGYTADVVAPDGLLHDWIDVRLLGSHLYSQRPDPEGLLSTLPSVATTLLGLLTGQWLRSQRDGRDKAIGMFFVANVLMVAGLWWDYDFPINKKIWTSSYVLLTGGLAMHFLAMCYWLMDVRGIRRWGKPFVVFGTNAIVVYFASSLLAKMAYRWKVTGGDGATQPLQRWVYEIVFLSWLEPLNASLVYALAYVALWLLLLLPLYRYRVFIKV